MSCSLCSSTAKQLSSRLAPLARYSATSTSRLPPLYPGHVRINTFQRSLLAVGSAFASLLDTNRHGPSPCLPTLSLSLTLRLTPLPRADMVAVLSETTGGPFLASLRTQIRSTPSGRCLLRERPRITEKSVDLAKLAQMKDGSLGREYVDWLRRNKVTPDTRDPVSLRCNRCDEGAQPGKLICVFATRSDTSTTPNSPTSCNATESPTTFTTSSSVSAFPSPPNSS
jgi:ubiquinone biosynthesis protein Coq4